MSAPLCPPPARQLWRPAWRRWVRAAFFVVTWAFLGFAVTALAMDPVQKLAALRGKQRVLLVFVASAEDPVFRAQRSLWEREQAGFAERDLVQLPVVSGPGSPDPLANRFHVPAGRFTVVLVGKDGYEAFRTTQPVNAAEIYGRIDAMPMRREEMRRQRQAGR